jgi:membrane protease subunit (stomatin/prohibitin family)
MGHQKSHHGARSRIWPHPHSCLWVLYAIRVIDAARFLTEIVGTDGEFTMDEISFQIRNIIVQEFSRVIAICGIPVLDMAANTADLGKLIVSQVSPTLAEYGLSMPEFYIENISLPPRSRR